MKKIVAVSGSLRTDSYNTNLLNKLSNIFKDEVEYEILDISSVPLFNEDIENDKNKYIDSLKNKIKNSDFVIISTPEYNYSVSGVLKNALDWFSRGENPVFENKDVGILSASPSKF
ncbi:MAG: NAD(P)H-dependent oxidoreductase [Tenericutes bacterium]|nr:NAD(P)H-dependent oxidoreductase [Mycoplasmatota bacterium]